jgi:signal transduction histidine kinase/CheY-like chemotaxis protein
MPGYAAGAVDYICKPFNPDILTAKVRAFVALYKLQRQSELLREREAEAMRELALRQAAESASRAKDEFIATLSHELRAPLNSILGWGQMLAAGKLGELPAPAARAVATIMRSAKLQSQVVEDLLDVSRIVAGKLSLKKQRFDVVAVVQAAVDAVRILAEDKNIGLQSSFPQSSGVMLGDANRVQQMLGNLLANAIKFTPPGGNVDISLTVSEEHVDIAVRDTGIGIARADLPRIFETFWQGERTATRSAGLGLGLPIVRKLVELHEGEISVASAGEGQGATFSVRLPLFRGAGLPPDGGGAVAVASSGRVLEGLHILLVDDDMDALDLLGAVLQDVGASVWLAASVAEAIGAVQQKSFDLAISDLSMPGEDGFSFVRRLNELSPRALPAIALSGHALPEDRARALDAGFASYVAKPLDPAALIALVAKVADRSA